MSIWYREIDLDMINSLNRGTLGEHFGIEFINIGGDFLEARMPVTERVKQPFGLLHGGASVALAETMGSVASWCAVNRDMFIGVGIEINANHLRQVTEGSVIGRCTAIKATGKMHVWEIKIVNDAEELCCVSRFTCMIVAKPTKG
jgi:1,4-dihydroxy-2-naphthoyl-CoA hydrolase